jgi:predicted secreted protein
MAQILAAPRGWRKQQASYARPMAVAFVAHCLLNQNSKVGDGAHCAGVYSPVVDTLRAKGWRIEQMPCPELAFSGLSRFWGVREQYDTAAYRRHCARLAAAVADAISVRVDQGEDIVLIGVEGSPSMGVTVTSSDPSRGGRPEWPDGTSEHVSGEGIYIEELRKALGSRGIGFPRVAGETHAIQGHDERVQRVRLESVLDAEQPDGARARRPPRRADGT